MNEKLKVTHNPIREKSLFSGEVVAVNFLCIRALECLCNCDHVVSYRCAFYSSPFRARLLVIVFTLKVTCKSLLSIRLFDIHQTAVGYLGCFHSFPTGDNTIWNIFMWKPLLESLILSLVQMVTSGIIH